MNQRSTVPNELVLLGTAAGPPPVPGRAGISTALKIGDRVYVVDCGRSSVTQYANAKLGFVNLAGIFITHLHADHVCDLWNFFLLGGGWPSPTNSLRTPIPVYGPATSEPPDRGVGTLLDRCNEAFSYSTNVFMRDSGILDLRTLAQVHEIPLPSAGASAFGPTAPTMAPVTIASLPDATVTGALVDHGMCFPSYAFRFDTPAGSVVFSGDTALCDNLVTLAKGADVLVHEAIDLEYYASKGFTETVLGHMTSSHTDISAVPGVAQAAGVPVVIVSHLAPGGVVTSAEWLAGAQSGAKKAGYTGRIIIGEDMMRFDLYGNPS